MRDNTKEEEGMEEVRESEGKPNNQGVYTLKDGSVYEGEFSNGKREGEGKKEIKKCEILQEKSQ